MASDTFKLKGSYSVTPAPTLDTSGDFEITAALLEQMSVKAKVAITVTLAADPAEALNFADLAGAHVVVIKTTGKVKAVFTSADGAAQSVPVDTFAVVMSASVPFTALSLQRVAGVATTARVLIAEKA